MRSIVGLFLALALVVPATAGADAIPGATYEGPVSGGGSVRFRVSGDGKYVTSFRTANVPGTLCEVEYIESTPSSGDGYPITNGSFSSLPLDLQFKFDGSFPGYQQASGTLSVFTSCITGTKSWTASTTATPPPPPDRTPPAVTLNYLRAQRLRDRVVVVEVRCPAEACRLYAQGVAWPSGEWGFGLGTKHMALEAGATATLRFKLKRKALAEIQKAHRKGRRTKAAVIIEAKDAADNRTRKFADLWIK